MLKGSIELWVLSSPLNSENSFYITHYSIWSIVNIGWCKILIRAALKTLMYSSKEVLPMCNSTFSIFKVCSSKYMTITQIKSCLSTLRYLLPVTERQTVSYRARRVYFGLRHSRSMLRLCLGKTFFIHLLSTGLPRRSADTVHFPDEGGGWTLCLSSDMLCTCNAPLQHANISMIMIKQQLQERGKVIQTPLLLFTLFSHYCHRRKKVRELFFPFSFFCEDVPVLPHFLHPPDDVEDGRYEELVVDGHSHVTWLVESRGYGADCVAEVHPPQQEQELRCKRNNKKVTRRVRG